MAEFNFQSKFSEFKELFSNRKTVISAVILIILILGLAIGVYLAQQRQIFKPKAATPKDEITLLTEQLLQADQKYDEIVSKTFIPQIATPSAQPIATSSAVQAEETSKEIQEQLTKMQGIAIKRKELLLQQIKENPQEFLNKATLVDKRDSFPKEVKPYIEQRIQAQGKLTVIHIDDFDNKKSRYEYFLENKYKLYFVKDPPQVPSGSEVKINGIELGKQVALSTGNAQPNQAGLQIIAAATLPPAIGEQKTAVLLVNFTDVPTQPATKEQIRNLILSTSNPTSINNYYKENSFNKMYLSGEVYGWYTISYNSCNNLDDIYRVAELANEAFAAENGFSISHRSDRYERIVYIYNTGRCFPTDRAGLGTLGGSPSISWIIWDRNQQNIMVYAHELGHNFSTHHANSYDCPLGTYNNCSSQEYGDVNDVMGNPLNHNSTPHFNAPHKVSVGWLEEGSNLKSISQDGIYTLAPLEVNTTNLQVIKIRKPDTNEYYYISYRQPIGFDAFALGSVTDGASIHIWSEDSVIQTKYLSKGVYTNYFDNTLVDGKVFNDAANSISIKQISHVRSNNNQEGSVTVEIRTSAPIPTLPPDYRRVFITSDAFNGNFGSVELADSLCQSKAEGKALGGEWKAWISASSGSPKSRFTKRNVPYKLLNGTIIADYWVDLIDMTLQNPINIDENMDTKPPDTYVWTGTYPRGFTIQPHCNNWTTNDSAIQGVVGNTKYKNFQWSNDITRGCGLSASLYCFEQTPFYPSTASPSASPSPTSFACTPCAADIKKDARNQVNASDYAILSSCFGKPPATVLSEGRSCTTADINKDGSINQADDDCLKSVYFQKC